MKNEITSYSIHVDKYLLGALNGLILLMVLARYFHFSSGTFASEQAKHFISISQIFLIFFQDRQKAYIQIFMYCMQISLSSNYHNV